MKRCFCGCFAMLLFFVPFLTGCASVDEKVAGVVRFHIRANSNSAEDQYIKYEIKDKVFAIIAPLLNKISCIGDAKKLVSQSVAVIEEYANFLLAERNVCYGAKVHIGKHFFEAKEIDGILFESGFYESVIVELGDGLGGNWWGLIFPNLSFFAENGNAHEAIVYKSKIVEIYDRIFQKL